MKYLIISVIGGMFACCAFLIWFLNEINGLRKEYKALKKVRDDLQEECKESADSLRDLQETEEKLTFDITQAIKERTEAQQRAAEAQEATQKLLAAEQRRLAAEMKSKKELEEVKLEQELNSKIQALNLYYSKQEADISKQYEAQKNVLDAEILFLKSQLDDFRARQESVHEAILRQKQLEEKEDFYSLQVSENDKDDIAVLQRMDLKLHNRDVIPKLIWDLFIRRPAQEMIKRVTSGRSISGIYKITNKQTHEAYIGKTTDISTRWQNHLKTAVGLEGAAKSTLHTRLAADGIWNYTFEILEEVPKDQLSAREAFYIDLYGTKKQLNMKEGSSK